MTSPNTISTSAPRRRLTPIQIAGALAGVALLAAVFINGGYFVTVIGFAAIYGIFCTGLNFFMGYTGQASFGRTLSRRSAAMAPPSCAPGKAGSRSSRCRPPW